MNQLSKCLLLLCVIFLPSTLPAATVQTVVNQKVNGGKWNKIGEWEWQAGTYSSVAIKNAGTNGYVIADAVMFENGTTQIIVDNRNQSSCKIEGAWVTSTAQTDFYGSNYIHDGNGNKGSMQVTFATPVKKSGVWSVSLYWSAYTNRADNVPVEINYNLPLATRHLTVVDGEGGGDFYPGDTCVITAFTPAAGMSFVKWINDIDAVVNTRLVQTAVIMPFSDVQVKALFMDSTANSIFRQLETGKSITIVAYGTSLTAKSSWVAQLDSILELRYPGQATVVNSGGSGMWSQWGVDNVESKVVSFDPDAVFIEFAMNDAATKFNCTLEMCRKNLETIIRAIRNNNPACQIILTTMNPSTGETPRPDLASYYQVYRDMARDSGYSLIDYYPLWKEVLETDPARFEILVPDGTHPTRQAESEILMPKLIYCLLDSVQTVKIHLSTRIRSSEPEMLNIQRHDGFLVFHLCGPLRTSSDAVHLTLYELSGAKIFSQLLSDDSIALPLKAMPSGMLLAVVTSGGKIVARSRCFKIEN